MIIIDKTKPPPPILEREEIPDFSRAKHPEQSFMTWLANEQEKWVEGVGEIIDGQHEIPGSLYFAVQHGTVKVRATSPKYRAGQEIPYECRDGNLLFHQKLRENVKKGRGTGVLKGRGFGLSTEIIGILPVWTWLTQPGSSVLATCKDRETLSMLFRQKLLPTVSGIDKRIFNWDKRDGNLDRMNMTKDSAYARVNIRTLENGVERDNFSEITLRDTTQSEAKAAAFSGSGAALVAIDEFFLHPHPEKVINSVIEAIVDRNSHKLYSLLIGGGTCEDVLTNEKFTRIKKIWDRIDLYYMEKLFLPASYGYNCINGWSDHKGFDEYFETKIEEFIRKGDSEGERSFRKNNPRCEEDVWQFATGGKYEEDVENIIKAQVVVVQNEDKHVPVAKTLVESEGEVKLIDDKKGKFSTLEPVLPDTKYTIDMDGILIGNAATKTTDETSKCAIIAMKGDSLVITSKLKYCPVMVYHHRPETVEQTYIAALLMYKHYNKYGNCDYINAEGSAGSPEHQRAFLEKAGYARAIPYIGNKPFFRRTEDNKSLQYLKANSFLRKYCGNIFYISLLEQFLLDKSENADLEDAFLMHMLLLKEGFDEPPKKKDRVIQRPQYVTRNGKLHIEWQTIATTSPA